MDDKTRKQRAVALKYNPEDVAPRVVAKGAGHVAEKIIEKGQAGNVPVYKDPNLVQELSKIDLGDSIPPELYEIIAQVLLFVSDLDRLEELRKNAGEQH